MLRVRVARARPDQAVAQINKERRRAMPEVAGAGPACLTSDQQRRQRRDGPSHHTFNDFGGGRHSKVGYSAAIARSCGGRQHQSEPGGVVGLLVNPYGVCGVAAARCAVNAAVRVQPSSDTPLTAVAQQKAHSCPKRAVVGANPTSGASCMRNQGWSRWPPCGCEDLSTGIV